MKTKNNKYKLQTWEASLISRGPDVLLCFQNWTSGPPFLQSYILCYTRGPDVGGPDVRLYFQNWTSGPPLLQCYILCNTGGPDVGGPDVGGPDVGGPDVGGPDVPHSDKTRQNRVL